MGDSKVKSILTQEAVNLSQTIVDHDHTIDQKRMISLGKLSRSIADSLRKRGQADIIVICTHNSRRSHIGQLALKLAALYYGIDGLRTYSGGTEATALNYRVVKALRSLGLNVKQLSEGTNPKYYIPLEKDDSLLDIHFSKPYDNSYNPQESFIALMVCNSADEACPVVTGAKYRVSLPYIDPKISDDTDKESTTYLNKVLEIGKEMFYVISEVKKSGT